MKPESVEAVAREIDGIQPFIDADNLEALARFVLRYSNRRVREALEGAASVLEAGPLSSTNDCYTAEWLRRLAAEVAGDE